MTKMSGVFARLKPRLGASLTRMQTIVGVTAGLVSISGALFSSQLVRPPAPALGEVVAVVQDARSDKPVAGATVEILTPDDAVVTMLTPAANGRARHALREGPYRVRVSHPKFGAEVRQVRVMAGHTAEVRLRLRSGTSTPIDHAERAVSESVSAVRRLFQ